jgi:hypothetical protein
MRRDTVFNVGEIYRKFYGCVDFQEVSACPYGKGR